MLDADDNEQLRDDECNIRRVLQYWFSNSNNSSADAGTEHRAADYNYKYKWFPGAISQNQQKLVDEEIFIEFNSLFLEALERKLHHWQRSISGSVALIVILDQFSRHICRHVGNMEREQRAVDSYALTVSKSLFGCHRDAGQVSQMDVMSLPVPQFVFSLMPLRHASALPDLHYVLGQLKEKEDREGKHLELLAKFRKQTTRQLQHLQDRELLEASDDILERQHCPSDEADIMRHPLVVALEQFLSKHLLHGSGYETRDDAALVPVFTVVVSLSGGVDSMVISKILVLLRNNRPCLRIKRVLAVHIDYGNRPESAREAEYIEKQWCAANGIQCRVRTIVEVTRGITNREQYEKMSREIRYEFYRTCLGEMASDGQQLVSGVIFGHHLGDVQENVLSNIMRGSSPLQLSGMTERSTANGVVVWRPLLRHNKDAIYSFAHRYGVPYFKDSTPSWSTRGKLRASLLPLLLDMYGTGCLSNLSQLAEESDRTRDLVQANLYDPFMSSIKRFPCGLKVNILPYRWQPHCFWREALRQLMHSMGMGMIREKAVSNFVERIQRGSNELQSGWLELRKGFHTQLTEEGDLIVLRDGCLGKYSDSSALVHTPNTVNHRRQQLLSRAKQFRTDPAALPELLSSLDSAFVRFEADIRELLIFHARIDNTSCSLEFDVTMLEETMRRDFPHTSSDQIASSNDSANLGAWSVALRYLFPCPEVPLTVAISVDDILTGRFSYPLVLQPNDRESPAMVLFNQVEKMRISHGEVMALLIALGSIGEVDHHETKLSELLDAPMQSAQTITARILLASISPFSGLQTRIKFGIPLLIPVTACLDTGSACAIQVEYSYLS